MKKIVKKMVALTLIMAVVATTSFHLPLHAATSEDNDMVKEYVFETIDDVKENFVSYYAPKNNYIEDTDAEGNPVFTSCDAANTWQVSGGDLIRKGSGDYAGYQKRFGPAALYTNEKYEDFSVEFDCFFDAFEGWGWISFGFGASDYGKTYAGDNYMVAIEKEGYIQLCEKSTSGTRMYNTQETAFTTARAAKEWIHVELSVISGKLTASYTYTDTTTLEEKTVSAQKELTGYEGGYLYLLSSSQYMHFKNLKITKHKMVEQVSDGGRILVGKNTEFSETGLPETLEAVCTDGTTTKVNIAWEEGNYDSAKDGLYKISGSVSAIDSYYVLSESISNVNYYVEVGDFDPRYTESFHILSNAELAESFNCYHVSKDEALAVDNVVATDVTNCWQIDSETNGIVRTGTDNYAAGAKANGASLLYFDDIYEDFEVEYEYCFSEVYSNWRQIGLGFGSPELGNTHLNDSYFAFIQQEGISRIIYAIDDIEQSARTLNGTAVETYQTQVKDSLADYSDVWHTVKYTISDGAVTIQFDENGPYSQSVPGYEGGYVYLYAATQGLKLRNIKVTNLQSGVVDTELLPTEYDVTNYTSGTVTNMVQGDTEFSFETALNGTSVPIKVTFPMEEGIRVRSEREGFFESDVVRKIFYEVSGDTVTATSGQDKVVLTVLDTGWALDFYSGDIKKTTLSSENIEFGFVDTEVKKIKFSFDAASGEKFYGLGERFNGVYQNGFAVSLWNEDVGYHTSTSTDPQDYVNSYANIPILHSTNDYTLFFNSTCAGTADICKTDENKFFFDFNEDIFDIYIWTNTANDNIQSYSKLTGLPYVPEKWAFRYWAGAGARVWGNSASSETEVLTVLDDMLQGYENMGIDNLAVLYGEAPLTNYASAYNVLSEKGIRALAWNRCSIAYATMLELLSSDTSLYPTIALASDSGKYYGNANYAYIDYSHPNATKLVAAQYGDDIALGLSGLMVDMGEKIGEDTVFYNGMTGAEMHNLYSYYYAKTINEVFTEKRGNDFVLFERSGSAGSSHYAAAFSGDQRADWNGLNLQLRGLISSASSGVPIYGGDIGGFYGVPSDENYMRWVQFSAFTPLMREHGVTEGAINPWDFGEDAQAVLKKYYGFRDTILDTVYSSALHAGATGEPMTKTLAMYDSSDSMLHGIEDEYIFCDSFLVAPITQEGVNYRNVTLPNGKWYCLYDGTSHEGGNTVIARAPEDRIPVYIKAGAVLPISVSDKYDLFESGDTSALLITAPEKTGSKTIYFNENTACEYTFDYVSSTRFVVKNDGNNNAVSVILHGYEADMVVLDGVELAQTNEGIGYSVQGSDTIIRMASSEWKNLEIHGRTNSSTYTDVISNSTIENSGVSWGASNTDYLKDNNPSTEWTASLLNTSFTITLPYSACDANLDIYWGEQYSSSYTVEYSFDKSVWNTLANITDSSGGKTTHILPDNTQYIKISGIDRNAAISDISVRVKNAEVEYAINKNKINYVDLSSLEVLDNNLVSYAVPGDKRIEDVDDDGDTYFKQVNNIELWKIEVPGILERNSTSTYQSTNIRSRMGAAALYLPDTYTDFEMNFQYSYSGIPSGWRWVSIGIGAEKIGDSYYDNGYLAYIEQDGQVKITGDVANGSVKTHKVNTKAIEGYGGEDGWHNGMVSVKGDKLTIAFDEHSYTYTLSNYSGGYIYLHSITEGMRYRNITITDYSDMHVSAEKVAEDFAAYRFTENENNTLGNPGFGVEYAACAVTDIFTVDGGDFKRINGTNYQNRKLAHLYYKELLSDFSFSFNYNTAGVSWDSIQIGFGADKVGDSVYSSGYLIEIDKDGTFHLKHKRSDVDELASTTYTDIKSDECSAKHTNDEDVSVSVVLKNKKLTVTINGLSKTIELSGFGTEGYFSFGAANSNIVFSNVSLVDLNAYNEIVTADSVKGEIMSGLRYLKEGESVAVDVMTQDGYRMKKDSLTYSYLGGNGLVAKEVSQDSDGNYTFCMPKYAVTLSAVFYMPYDTNADQCVDICDLVKMNHYLSSQKYSIDEAAADTDESGVINEKDFAHIREELVKEQ